jgi:DNA-binding NarL/FixJ family response regulator
MTIKVLLADDQVLLRSSLAMLIDREPDMKVVGEASDGAEAVALAARERPDVVLMDIRMPGTDGLQATTEILSQPDAEGVRVIMLTTFELDDYVLRALRAGARGVKPVELLEAIRLVAAGEALLAPSVTRRLLERIATPQTADDELRRGLDSLTPRELEVLTLVGSGLSNAEISHKLVLSPATVKTHVNRVMMKLAVHDRAQLVIVAYESGLVTPSGGWHER